MSYVSDLLSIVTPKASPAPLIRMGGNIDGAYLVPDDLQGIKACFSPGVNNRKVFEDELATQHGIRSHMCDFSSDVDQLSTPLIPDYQTFDKKWLDIDGGADSISLQEWIAIYAPDPGDDLLLQIDIEGAEFRNLNSATEDTLRRFRIIVIELHELTDVLNPGRVEVELAPLLRKLDKTHICVHAHPNNCCGDAIDPESGRNIPRVIELTLLRRDRFDFEGASAAMFPPCMPHPLDIAQNVPSIEPLHMNGNWLGIPDSDLASQLKKTEDKLHFITYTGNQRKVELDKLLAFDDVIHPSLHALYRVIGQAVGNHKTAFELPSDLETADLAKGKTFVLSDSFANLPTNGLVHDHEPFFFHTAIASHQSITIDLERSVRLDWLIMKNRTDSCWDRAKYLFWSLHDDPSFATEHLLPVLTTKVFLSTGKGLSATPLLGRSGRYFTLYSPTLSAIHLSSLRIYPSK
jgi:hypothetical protein